MRILKGKPGFSYGNCAPLAIGQAFNIPLKIVEEVFRLVKIEPCNGITTVQCRKIIRAFTKGIQKKVKYYPFRHISIKEFAKKHPKGVFLVNFPQHLAYYKNGVFKDTYLQGLTKFEVNQEVVVGAWEIKEKQAQQFSKNIEVTINSDWIPINVIYCGTNY